jgi:hypothetical protein
MLEREPRLPTNREHLAWAYCCLALALGSSSTAASGPRPLHPTATNSPATSLQLTNAPFKRVAPGVFELGKVRLDKQQRTVQFPAAINMAEGLLEYAVVAMNGKLHESLLMTEADPVHIHLAMLLLGAKGETNPPATSTTAPPVIAGDKVNVWVDWKWHGTERRVRIEQMIYNLETRSPVSRGPWTYNGSRVVEGTYLAHRDGSIVALITDPDALINNPRPGRDNDQIWFVNTDAVPRADTPVQVTVELNPTTKPVTK